MLPLLFLSYLSASPLLSSQSSQPASSINLTALSARNSISVLECWQLALPSTRASGFDVLQMGDTANASYYIMPPRFDSGRHPGPARQYVWVVSGVLHNGTGWLGLIISNRTKVSLPNATDEVTIHGGRYGLLYVEDTSDVSAWGHRTTFPGYDETVLLMLPVRDGVNPPHTVLHDGPCKMEMPVVGSGE
ncbi:uncharacterized protein F4812DRAFT_67217 [Daldinia caldariorum]|uniref:uncharacterized protein n=1 Tax=Daldinia caldariorum TaxID=326644 RepID=UPI002007C639|nr:uncharacterized protein F4812DRAFT_67217 [Daldinia caldariorum]KAI1466796.1 hypothetical protein F4812DRAFT_67217 [Daldinia caldariorum]